MRAELLLARQDPAELQSLVNLVQHEDHRRALVLLFEHFVGSPRDWPREPLSRRLAITFLGLPTQPVPQISFAYRVFRADLPNNVEDLLLWAFHNVDDEHTHVALLVPPPGCRDKFAVLQPLVRRDDPGHVNKDELCGPYRLDAPQPFARRVHLGRHGADGAIQDGVHERGLPRVGRAGQPHTQRTRIRWLHWCLPRLEHGLRGHGLSRVVGWPPRL
mmetsp:Transcript_58489/g.161855  ORF Transcript_58489/g.161855 Transcript_58489/m.161855 type:complete len:217 (+) Transcript_58489:540-1190(+)